MNPARLPSWRCLDHAALTTYDQLGSQRGSPVTNVPQVTPHRDDECDDHRALRRRSASRASGATHFTPRSPDRLDTGIGNSRGTRGGHVGWHHLRGPSCHARLDSPGHLHTAAAAGTGHCLPGSRPGAPARFNTRAPDTGGPPPLATGPDSACSSNGQAGGVGRYTGTSKIVPVRKPEP